MLCSFLVTTYYYMKSSDKDSLKLTNGYDLQNYRIINYILTSKNANKHNIKIIYDKDDILHDEITILKDILKNNESKNNIVHCSLTNELTNDMIELTSLFREFLFHFDKKDNRSFIKNFLEYVKVSYDLDNINNYTFIVYLNDENFTELKYNNMQLDTLRFYDIVQITNTDINTEID